MADMTVTIKLETELSPAQVEALFSRVSEPAIKITNISLVTKRRKTTIYDLIQAQEQWIMEHGRNLEGYVARYGSIHTPERYGNGGEAIYEADLAELKRLRKLIGQ